MSYEEFVTSIQQAVEANLSTGNIIFGILLFIGIVVGLVFFFLYTRKEYYRKRSEIDPFMLDGVHKTDIYIPELEERANKVNKETFLEKLYKKLSRE